MQTREACRAERGQATIVMVGVIAIALVLLVAVATFGQAVVHRTRATSAADAVAHARAIEPSEAVAIEAWYRSHGADSSHRGRDTIVGSGPSQAAALAESGAADIEVAPALVAIVARAGQLLGTEFVPLRWNPVSVEFGPSDGDQFALVASELGLCPAVDGSRQALIQVFELC